MSNAYIAVGYACNQKCSFCPCSENDYKQKALDIYELKNIVDDVKSKNVDNIVISGGEPTIHKILPELVSYILEKDININILSNSEKFSDEKFFNKMLKIFDKNKVVVTTTIHSQNKNEHENINQTKGSFERTLKGLKNLSSAGIHIIVKHCITALNHKDLKAFYEFANNEFNENASIQLCSIDYCGINEQDLEEHKVVYPKLQPYFEEMFDKYEEDINKGSRRRLYCINMPLCACDPYYWKYFMGKGNAYKGYSSPNNRKEVSYENMSDVGTFSDNCQKCRANEICAGTYRSAYALFGDEIFEPYE